MVECLRRAWDNSFWSGKHTFCRARYYSKEGFYVKTCLMICYRIGTALVVEMRNAIYRSNFYFGIFTNYINGVLFCQVGT